MYKHYNPNPANARVGDCAVRAMCKALGRDWVETYIDLILYGLRLCDLPSANSVWGKCLSDNGFVKRNLPLSCASCYTLEDFTTDHPKGVFVVVLQGHVVTVVDGDYYDTWNSGDEVPLYYWEKED